MRAWQPADQRRACRVTPVATAYLFGALMSLGPLLGDGAGGPRALPVLWSGLPTCVSSPPIFDGWRFNGPRSREAPSGWIIQCRRRRGTHRTSGSHRPHHWLPSTAAHHRLLRAGSPVAAPERRRLCRRHARVVRMHGGTGRSARRDALAGRWRLREQVNECWRIATRISGLLRLVSDAACEPRLIELEGGIESLPGSLEHWADRMQGIEGTLEGIRGRAARRSADTCLPG